MKKLESIKNAKFEALNKNQMGKLNGGGKAAGDINFSGPGTVTIGSNTYKYSGDQSTPGGGTQYSDAKLV
ncbi:MAG: hypothetical protein PHD97_00050 [Bacteroidales bacterium]|nr:hypothetical protein [Bacteroidales bacterium]